MGLARASLAAAVVLLAAVTPVASKDIPDNLKSLYQNITSQDGCDDVLAKGFYGSENDDGSSKYCGDYKDDFGIIFLKGPGKKLVNMDVDCDGAQNKTSKAHDGRCGSSEDTQSITSFQDTIQGYKKGPKDLDAYIQPYVVFGNEGSKPHWATFNPEDYGIEPLSIIAVVCGDELIYGIWGDTNGDDGDDPMVGEAAISLATACYGKKDINGNSGHDDPDVLYLAFTGKDAVPGADGAKWDATSYDEFEQSIESLGDKLVERIGPNSTFSGGDGDKGDDDSSSWALGAPNLAFITLATAFVFFW